MNRFFIILIMCCFHLSATGWETSWVKAVQNCKEHDYESAEKNFTEAILSMEAMCDMSAPHIYVDRGRLYYLLDRNEECLKDLNRVRNCLNKSTHI